MAQIAEEKDAWGAIFDGLFWCASKVRGKHWELDDDECEELSGKVAEALARNLPESWLQKYNERVKQGSPVVGSIAVAGTILYERIEQDRAIAAANKARAASTGVGRGRADYPSRPIAQVPDAEADREEDTERDS